MKMYGLYDTILDAVIEEREMDAGEAMDRNDWFADGDMGLEWVPVEDWRACDGDPQR